MRIYFYAHAKLCQKCATDVSRRYIQIDCKITWQYYSLLQNVITISSLSLPLSSLSFFLSLERGGKSAQQLSTRRRRQWRRWRRLLQSQEVSAPDNKNRVRICLSLSLVLSLDIINYIIQCRPPFYSSLYREGQNLLHEPRVRILFLSFLLLLFLHLCNSTYYLANCTDYTQIHTHIHTLLLCLC